MGNQDQELFEKKHDEASRTLRRTTFSILAFGLFSIFTLLQPDVNLVSNNAKIKLTLSSVEISYTGFLIVGPIVLLCFWVYQHVYRSYLTNLELTSAAHEDEKGRLPFIFFIPGNLAKLLSELLLYWQLPLVLSFFSWKAVPRPESKFVLPLTVLVCAVTLQIKINQSALITGQNAKHVLTTTLWVLSLNTILITSQSENFPSRVLTLSGEDLSRQDLRFQNLRGAELNLTNLQGARLSGSDLSGANLSGADLRGADLQSANLSNAILVGSNLVGARLVFAKLRGVRIDGGTELDDKWRLVIRLQGESEVTGQLLVLTGRDLSFVELQQVKLDRADLRGTSFNRSNLHAASLTEATLVESNLIEADLSSADLELANLSDALLQRSNLQGANLSKAVLLRADMESANIANCTLVDADLTDANLDWIDFRGARINENTKISLKYTLIAKLQRSDRSLDLNKDLQGADLSRSNLRGCFLAGANLRGANLEDSNLQNADLSGIQEWNSISSLHNADLNNVHNPPRGFLEFAQRNGASVSSRISQRD